MDESKMKLSRNNEAVNLAATRKKSIFGVGWNGGSSKARLFLRQIFHIIKHLKSAWGISRRTCCICGETCNFYAYGCPPRYDAACSNCGSLERHRLLYLWLERNTEQWHGKRVLHFAPDVFLRGLVECSSSEYIAADLVATSNCRQLDIEEISLLSNSIDLIICSHVIEHVDDKKALSEMRRVLDVEGVALIMAPIIDGWNETYENPLIKTSQDRILHFGQDDHVRYYGLDIVARIESAGFAVDTFVAVEPDVLTYGLQRGDKVFVSKAGL